MFSGLILKNKFKLCTISYNLAYLNIEKIAMDNINDNEEKSRDRITQKIGVLNRRETEARILVPLVESLVEAFGKEEVIEILSKTIKENMHLSQRQYNKKVLQI